MQLEGKVALVTGGSRGIGRAISLALAEAGASVALTYREQQASAAEVVASIAAAGGRALAVRMDVLYRHAVRAGIEQVEATFGGLDVLVNNAGMNKPADFDCVTDADWDEVLAVNLKGPFVCMQEALPALRRRGGGSRAGERLAQVRGRLGRVVREGRALVGSSSHRGHG